MIKEGNIYTYFVDPKKRIIQHRQINQKNWYEEMRSKIGCRLIETHKVLDNPPVRWFGDEEGLLKDEGERHFFTFSTVENLSTGQRIFNNTRIIKKYRETYSEPIVWEFCGPAFFCGYYDAEDEEKVSSVQLHLWEFAQCIEFMHEGFQVEPTVEFQLID